MEMSEKLRLVVLYPVLGENYKSLENDYMEAVSCGDNINVNDGDVVNEMKRQIQANSTRISILEQQNTSLRNSLVKLEISENDVYYKNTQVKNKITFQEALLKRKLIFLFFLKGGSSNCVNFLPYFDVLFL